MYILGSAPAQKRAEALEQEAACEQRLNGMLERRVAMLEEALRRERAVSQVRPPLVPPPAAEEIQPPRPELALSPSRMIQQA